MTDVAASEIPADEGAAARGRGSRLFWRYWAATTASSTGDAVTAVALPLVAVKVLHASALEVSAIAACTFAAWIAIGLPAGVIVGRLPARGLQLACDLARAALLAFVPIAWACGVLAIWQLVVVALGVGFMNVLFDVGNAAFLPSILSPGELVSRNSLVSGSQAATQLGGPAAGGVLIQAIGPVPALVVDAASYIASAVILWPLPRLAPTRAAGGDSVSALIREGLRYVTRHPTVRACLAAATTANFVCGALLALMPIFLVRTLAAPSAVVGLVFATDGLGSLLGAALVPSVTRRLGSARTVRAATFVGALFALAMPLASAGPGVLLYALGNTGFAVGVVFASVLARTHRQVTTPPALLPRVMATVRFVSWGALPIGSITAGAIATAWSPRAALWVACLCAFAVPLSFMAPAVRRERDLI